MKILIAIDGSPNSAFALQEACRLLPVSGAETLVLSVLDTMIYAAGNEGMGVGLAEVIDREELAIASDLERARAFLTERGARADAIEREGDPATVILETARAFQPDVIVLGSHGRGPLGRLILGSVSDKVLHNWAGSVLVIRPQA
jgi:nucleotide-binding universal stress UspA family protein